MWLLGNIFLACWINNESAIWKQLLDSQPAKVSVQKHFSEKAAISLSYRQMPALGAQKMRQGGGKQFSEMSSQGKNLALREVYYEHCSPAFLNKHQIKTHHPNGLTWISGYDPSAVGNQTHAFPPEAHKMLSYVTEKQTNPEVKITSFSLLEILSTLHYSYIASL